MNPYDDPALFAAYAGMERSRRGLAGAAEWEQLRALLPPEWDIRRVRAPEEIRALCAAFFGEM